MIWDSCNHCLNIFFITHEVVTSLNAVHLSWRNTHSLISLFYLNFPEVHRLSSYLFVQ